MVALPTLPPATPPQLTSEPDTAMSSSVLMATHVTSASWPYRTWTGLGAKPLENPPWRWGHGDLSDLVAVPTASHPIWGVGVRVNPLPAVGPATPCRWCPGTQK